MCMRMGVGGWNISLYIQEAMQVEVSASQRIPELEPHGLEMTGVKNPENNPHPIMEMLLSVLYFVYKCFYFQQRIHLRQADRIIQVSGFKEGGKNTSS